MNTFAKDFIDRVVLEGLAAGKGDGDGWRAYRNNEPELVDGHPGNTITAIDTGGPAADIVLDPAKQEGQLHYPTIQVRIRTRKATDCETKAYELYLKFRQYPRFSIASAGADLYYEGMFAEGEPFPLDRDSGKRSIWILNLKARRKIKSV